MFDARWTCFLLVLPDFGRLQACATVMNGWIGPCVGPPDPWVQTHSSGPSWTSAVLTAQVVVASYSGLCLRGGRTKEMVGAMASLRSMFWHLSLFTRGTHTGRGDMRTCVQTADLTRVVLKWNDRERDVASVYVPVTPSERLAFIQTLDGQLTKKTVRSILGYSRDCSRLVKRIALRWKWRRFCFFTLWQ